MPNILPRPFDQYAKAIYPFVATVLTVLINAGFGNPLDIEALRLAAIGVALATLSFVVPNMAQDD